MNGLKRCAASPLLAKKLKAVWLNPRLIEK